MIEFESYRSIYLLFFITSIEENLFPAYWNQNDEKQLEEERRLCYVAITRAKMQLILSYAKMRDQYGQTHMQKPSRFIKELRIDNMDLISDYAKIKRPRLASQIKNTNNPRSDIMTDPETCVTTEQMFKNQELLDEVEFKAGDSQTVSLIETLKEHYHVDNISRPTSTGIGVKVISEHDYLV